MLVKQSRWFPTPARTSLIEFFFTLARTNYTLKNCIGLVRLSYFHLTNFLIFIKECNVLTPNAVSLIIRLDTVSKN